MNIVILVLLIVLSALSIWWIPGFKYCAIRRGLWLGAWGLKLIAGMLLFGIFTQHYADRSKSDIFRFYDDGVILKEVAYQNSSAFVRLMWGPLDEDPLFAEYLMNTNNVDQNKLPALLGSNDLMVKLHALFSFFPGSSWYSNALLFNYLGFTGLFLLFSFLHHHWPGKKYLLFGLLLLFPSLLLWTSGPLKETLILLGCGLTARSLYILNVKRSWIKALPVFLLGVVLLALTKLFMAAIFIPLALVYTFNYKTKQKRIGLNYAILMFIFLTLFFELGKLSPSADIPAMMVQKNQQFIELAQQDNAGSLLDNPVLENNTKAFAKAIPHALANTLLRPLPWNIHSTLHLMMFAENLLLFGFILFLLFKSQLRLSSVNLFLFLFLSGAMIVFAYGMIVPVLGALARYRTIGLLLMALAFLDIAPNEALLFNKKKQIDNE